MLDNTIISKYEKWLKSDKVSEEMKKELAAIREDEEEMRLRFAAPLSFGTAGLRGIMAAGIGNMNIHTVAQATQGLADYINDQGMAHRGVAVCFDSRNNSELFSEICAEVLTANGIKTYRFEAPHPTPELSFAVRELNCIAGINITASHNPKEYNGYKAYWEDGAQLGPEQADAVSEKIAACDIFEGVKRISLCEAKEKGLYEPLGGELDEKYLANVLAQRIDKNAIPSQSDMAIVYTPLHGTGHKLVPEVLRRAGLKNIITVPEQSEPDGDFPTVKFPNPEFPEAFALGKKLASANGCDLIIATDPDADRMGIMIRDGEDYVGLTGNQVGCLLLDYIITAYRENGGIPSDAYAVKSIVSTELASEIARANGVKMFDVLTGFKFIGEVIKNHEKLGYGTYLLGFEESYGYLKGTYARDKDAVVASLLVTEMAAYYREKGMTLKNAIDALYRKYGSYGEKVISISVPGSDGKEKMKKMMENLRAVPPTSFCSEKIVSVRDYLNGTVTVLASGKTEPTGLPASDVLYFTTESTVVVFRPSGTEPKIKAYFMAKGKTQDEVDARLESCKAEAQKLLGV